MARGEIVAAVEHYIVLRQKRFEQCGVSAQLDRCDHHLRVEPGNGGLNRAGFGLPDPLRGVGNLALQVGEVNAVVVYHGEVAHARTGQVECGS